MNKLQRFFNGGGKKLHLFLVLLLSVAGMSKTFATDFYIVIDGSLWGFNYIDTENHYVEVASGPNKSTVDIPGTVNQNLIDYTVIGIGT